LKRLFPGANRDIFYPQVVRPEERDERFTVSFHGKLIPGMLGTEYIIEVARILKDEPILFKIFGKGSLYEEYEEIIEKEQLSNLKLCGYLQYEDVPYEVSKSDVLLGAFGTTPKALKVIPLKLFEGIALAKAQIIGDTPAARELFEDKVHVLYANLADGKDLAEKILFMRNNPALRESIAKNGYALYQGVLSDEEVGKKLKSIFDEII
jgi:glycosyltransferase involved in cell wall biosynthesis